MNSIYQTEEGKQAIFATYRQILSMWPVANRQYHIPTSYGDTFVIESGDRNKPALMLLHGSMSNSFSWFADVPFLCEDYCVYAIDLIGEAGFSAESRPAYESGAYEKWLHEVASEIGREHFGLIGLSLGGWMALRYATIHPENIDRLILLCPGGLAEEKHEFIEQAMERKAQGSVESERTVEEVLGEEKARDESMDAVIAYIKLIGDQEIPRTEELPIFTQAELSKMKMPILVIFGEDDVMLRPQESIDAISRSATNVTVQLLPNTGHAVIGQGERILKFLREQSNIS